VHALGAAMIVGAIVGHQHHDRSRCHEHDYDQARDLDYREPPHFLRGDDSNRGA